MNDAEIKDKDRYIDRCSNPGNSPLKNYGKTFYGLFSTNLSKASEPRLHLQKITADLSTASSTGEIKKLIFNDWYSSGDNFLPLSPAIQNVLNLKDKIILDFGCGSGQFCNDATTQFGAATAYGLDLVTVEMGLTDKYKTDKCIFMTSGIDLEISDNSVDIVTSFLVLEHIHEQHADKMLSEFQRVARLGFLFQISHRPGPTPMNMRANAKPFLWWYNKLFPMIDECYIYYLESDNYKWGCQMSVEASVLKDRIPEDLHRWAATAKSIACTPSALGLSRVVCTLKKAGH